jgi:hypothetical protein
MLSLQDEIRKRKSELVLMESELASMEDRSTYPKDAAHFLQDRRVCMLMSGRPVRVGTTKATISQGIATDSSWGASVRLSEGD